MSSITRSRQSHNTEKPITSEQSPAKVEIKVNKSNIKVFQPNETAATKEADVGNADLLGAIEKSGISVEKDGSVENVTMEDIKMETSTSSSIIEETTEKEAEFAENHENLQAKTLLDMLVGKKKLKQTSIEDRPINATVTDKPAKKNSKYENTRIDKLKKNTAEHRNILKKSLETGTKKIPTADTKIKRISNVDSTQSRENIPIEIPRITEPRSTAAPTIKDTNDEDFPVEHTTYSPSINSDIFSSLSNEETGIDFDNIKDSKTGETVTLIKASYNSNDPKSKNITGQAEINGTSEPVINAVSMTKVSVGDGYSNIEKSEYYDFSHETSSKSTDHIDLDSSRDKKIIAKKESPSNDKPHIERKALPTPHFHETLKNTTNTTGSLNSESLIATSPTLAEVKSERVDRHQDQIPDETSATAISEKPPKYEKSPRSLENEKEGDTMESTKSKSKMNIVETRPKYLKFFSKLKKAQNEGKLPAVNSNNSKVPNNLNKNDRITLAMVSEAIEKGLDSLLSEPKSTKRDLKKDTENKNGTNDMIEFIYIGLSPSPQLSNKTNVLFLNADDLVPSETRQVERKRRNTKLHKHHENEIVKSPRVRSRPIFYIPWRQRLSKEETKKITDQPVALPKTQLSAESLKIVEAATQQTAETVNPVTPPPQNIIPDANVKDQQQKAEIAKVIVTSTPVVQTSEEKKLIDTLTSRRSRSRMTIPGLRTSRNRAINGTKLNERLSAFTKTAYDKYRKPNAKSRNLDTTQSKEVPQQTSSQNSFSRRRLRGRRVQNEAPEENATEDAALVVETEKEETAPARVKNNANDKVERLRNMRQRLLRRRRPSRRGNAAASEKVEDNITEQPVELVEEVSQETITEPPEVLKKSVKTDTVSASTNDKETDKETTTLPILDVKTDGSSIQPDNVEEPAIEPPKRGNQGKSLSARLRLRNRLSSRHRKVKLPVQRKTTPTTALKILNQQPAKSDLETEAPIKQENVIKLANPTAESDQTLNAIDNEQKIEENLQQTVQRRRRPSSTHRERLLKLIRARARARKPEEKVTIKATEVTEKTPITSTAKPIIVHSPITKVQPIVPRKVELKKVPIKVVQENHAVTIAPPKKSQSIRQRLQPKPVGNAKSFTPAAPIRSLLPVRILQPQQQQAIQPVRQPSKEKTITAVMTTKAPITRPPQRSFNFAVTKQNLHPINVVAHQRSINKVAVTPKTTPHVPKVFSAPRINQIVTQRPPTQVLAHQNHFRHPQAALTPTQPPQQRIAYQPVNQLVHAQPNQEQYNTHYQNQHQVPIRNHNPNNPYHDSQRRVVQVPHPQPAHRSHQTHQAHQPHQVHPAHQTQPAHPTHPPRHHHQQHRVQHTPKTTTKKPEDFESLLPTEDDFPEMKDDYEIPNFDFGHEEYEYKEPQFVIDYRKKQKEKEKQESKKEPITAPKEEPTFTLPEPNFDPPKDTFNVPKESKVKKQGIPEGAKVTENEYFVEGPSGVPIKVTTVTFHTSKSTVRNENVKNRSSHFKRDPFNNT